LSCQQQAERICDFRSLFSSGKLKAYVFLVLVLLFQRQAERNRVLFLFFVEQ
jgi:hypothetical protein